MKTIERVILLALMRNMRAQGYEVVSVWEGENYRMPDRQGELQTYPHGKEPDIMFNPMTDEQALTEIDSVDESTLHFTHRHSRTWGNRGVLVVLGNGEDCLSDFHGADRSEPFQKIVTDIYDKLNKGELP